MRMADRCEQEVDKCLERGVKLHQDSDNPDGRAKRRINGELRRRLPTPHVYYRRSCPVSTQRLTVLCHFYGDLRSCCSLINKTLTSQLRSFILQQANKHILSTT